jgi:hypothetical protein
MPLRHLIALIINAHPDDRIQTTDDRYLSVVRPLTSVVRSALIRKTSLLHKIDPTALRSSFADGSGIRHQMSGIKIVLIPDP